MAVHIPLSLELRSNAVCSYCLSTICFLLRTDVHCFSDTDIVLGLYYLTKERQGAMASHLFGSIDEVKVAYTDGYVQLHACIKLRLLTPVWGQEKPSMIIQPMKKGIFLKKSCHCKHHV